VRNRRRECCQRHLPIFRAVDRVVVEQSRWDGKWWRRRLIAVMEHHSSHPRPHASFRPATHSSTTDTRHSYQNVGYAVLCYPLRGTSRKKNLSASFLSHLRTCRPRAKLASVPQLRKTNNQPASSVLISRIPKSGKAPRKACSFRFDAYGDALDRSVEDLKKYILK
jgi:hypothetical protein